MIPPLSDLGHTPLIMGILNITPDSFSGDGLIGSTARPSPLEGEEAKTWVCSSKPLVFAGGGSPYDEDSVIPSTLHQAESMIASGAAILDIGGESSRPGSTPVSIEEEIRRTVPVIAALHKTFPATPLSIDTVKPEVADAAIKAGVSMINDISGAANPAMLALAAASGAYLVLMHNRSAMNAVESDARLGAMYEAPVYDNFIEDVQKELKELAERAIAPGVKPERIILDPGLGFGKTVEQNLRLMNELDRFKALGFPLLVGPSRKSFIGRVLNLAVDERLEGTAAAVAVCVLRGAAILRVHDVKEMSRVVRMTAAIRQA